jgi:outer membrane lipase/esterase
MAVAFNGETANVSPDMASVLNTLNVLTPAQFNAAMDQISPIGYAALGGIGLTSSRLASAAVGRRIAALQSGIASAGGSRVDQYASSGFSPYPGTLVADAGGGPVPPAEAEQERDDSPWGLFFAGLDTIARQDGRQGAAGFQPGYDFVAYGGSMGFDYRFADGFAAGLTGGYLTGSSTIDDGVGSLTDSSFRFGAYAAGWSDAWHGSLYLGWALDSYTTTRDIPSFGRTANASPSGGEFDMDASLGYDVKSGATTLSPFGGLSIERATVGGFTESNAGALDLNVGPQTDDSVRAIIGATLSHRFGFDENWFGLTPAFSAAWEHEFANQSRSISAQFAEGGAPFAVGTADVSREALLSTAGLGLEFGKDVTLRFGYSADVRSDFLARTIDANIRVRF